MSNQDYKSMRGDEFSPRPDDGNKGVDPPSCWNKIDDNWKTNIEYERVKSELFNHQRTVGNVDHGDNFLLAESFLSASKKKMEIEDICRELDECSLAPVKGTKRDSKTRNYKSKNYAKGKKHNRDGYKKRKSKCIPEAAVSSLNELEQIGELSSKIREHFANVCGFNEASLDSTASAVETLIIFGSQVYRSNNMTDVMVAAAAALKGLVPNRSLIGLLHECVFSVEPEAEVTTKDALIDCSTNFTILKNNPVWKHVSYTISAVCSMFVAEWQGFSYDVGTFNLIKIPAMKEQQSASDLIEAILRTLEYFLGAGSRCLKEKSLKPLLFEKPEAQAYENEFSELSAKAEIILNGNYNDKDNPISKEFLDDLESRCQTLIATTAKMKSQIKTFGFGAEILQKRYERLVVILEKIIARRKGTTTRPTPMGFSIFGDSSVGKSSIATYVGKTALAAMGLSTDSKFRCVLDPFSNYDDTYTTDILQVDVDDVANSKPKYAKQNSVDMTLKFFNCVCALAVKAELHQKGLTFIEFAVGTITTNKKDLDAPVYSNAPEAVLRRFHHITVRVLPKYQKAGSLMLNEEHPDLLKAPPDKPPNDVWEFDLERIHTFKAVDGSTKWRFAPRIFEGREMMGITLKQLLKVVASLAKQHKSVQENMVYRLKELDRVGFCPLCSALPGFCECPKEKPTPEAGVELAKGFVKTVLSNALRSYVEPFTWITGLPFIGVNIGDMATREFTNMVKDMCAESTLSCITYMPQWLYECSPVYKTVEWWTAGHNVFKNYEYYRRCRKICRNSFIGCIFGFILSLFVFPVFCVWFVFFGAFFVMWYLYCYFACVIITCRARPMAASILADRRDGISEIAKNYRDGILGGTIAIIALTTVIGVILKYYSPAEPEADSEESHPGWMGNLIRSITYKGTPPTISKNATTSQLVQTFKKNLWFANVIQPNGKVLKTNAFIPRKSMVFLPHHSFFPDGDMNKDQISQCELRLFNSTKPGGKIVAKIDESSIYYFPGRDLVAIYLPRCPNIKSNYKWLSKTPVGGQFLAKHVRMYENFEIHEDSVYATSGDYDHRYRDFYGYKYSTKIGGTSACMSLLIKDGKEPVLAGLHIAGDGWSSSRAMSITLDDYNQAYSALDKRFNLSAESNREPACTFGRDLITNKNPHFKSAFVGMDNEVSFEVLGSTHLRRVSKSAVQPSILAPFVNEVFPGFKEYGPPQMTPNWKAYNASLDHLKCPESPFFPDKLRRAAEDYLAPLLPLASKSDIRPLTLDESINGIPGKRFIDRIDMSTSGGFGLEGPKNKYFDVEVHDDHVKYIPCEAIVNECERVRQCLIEGERCYPIYTSCLKDTPTATDSSKVRVFQCGQVGFGLVLRQYFLPVVRFMGLNPIVSECAVGVNCFSPEWEDLVQHIESKGEERILAWDYSKYDMKMSSEITREALWIMIQIAEAAGYDELSLKIMKNMVVDICHPIVDWNGTVLSMIHMNPSGNNITVQINSIGGSLYVRMGFFEMFPRACNFRDHVAAMTYGDDFAGTVDEEHKEFNCITFAEWGARHGKKITPPNKDGEIAKFEKEVEFLKRKSNYIPEIGCRLGALDRGSIVKSLKANLQSSSASPREIALSCLEGAAHEAFAYGREEYEDWMEKLKIVAEGAQIRCPILDISFDERVEKWHHDYS